MATLLMNASDALLDKVASFFGEDLAQPFSSPPYLGERRGEGPAARTCNQRTSPSAPHPNLLPRVRGRRDRSARPKLTPLPRTRGRGGVRGGFCRAAVPAAPSKLR